MDLQTRFPITFAKCEKHIKKYRKNPPNIITSYGITYDRSVIPLLTQSDIDYFTHLQLTYPETINECFTYLTEILDNLEQSETKIVTRNDRKTQQTTPTPMDKIRNSLTQINGYENDELIDKWVLFIQSQNEFNRFF